MVVRPVGDAVTEQTRNMNTWILQKRAARRRLSAKNSVTSLLSGKSLIMKKKSHIAVLEFCQLKKFQRSDQAEILTPLDQQADRSLVRLW